MGCKGNGLIIISGPSGVGKDSVITRIRHLDPSISLSVSATTRLPRFGEVDGIDYHFLSKKEFESKIKNSEFLEYAEYCGNYYGTLKYPIDRAIQLEKKIILKIEVQGAFKVRDFYPECLSVFIAPPSMSTLRERISSRNLDDDHSVGLRLKKAKYEISQSKYYDFVVENDTTDACARKILNKIYEFELKGGFYETNN